MILYIPYTIQKLKLFDFLGIVQFFYSFIEGSPIKHAVFENTANKIKFLKIYINIFCIYN